MVRVEVDTAVVEKASLSAGAPVEEPAVGLQAADLYTLRGT